MEQRKHKLGLIHNKATAVVGLVSTGFLAAMAFRSAFSHSPRSSHWLLSLDFMLPGWTLVTVNIAFYVYLLWLSVVFFRIAQGKERLLVAGWVPGILLSPVQSLVSTSAGTAIQSIKAASLAIALIAAVSILLEDPARHDARSDNNALS